jgi:hypothetical protein
MKQSAGTSALYAKSKMNLGAKNGSGIKHADSNLYIFAEYW